MPKQVTVFLENEQGRLASMCRTLADAGVNMHALTVADTASYGVARLLVDDHQRAVEALLEAEYRAKLVEVSAARIPNVPGGLAVLLEAFNDAGLNLEYAYCFASSKESVVVVFRVEDPTNIAKVIDEIGYELVTTDEF